MEIGIVGLGLIGGSLGIDLRSLGHRVLGVSRRAETGDRAVERGAVDVASPDLALLRSVDVAFVCTPLGVMEATVRELVPHLPPDAALTDVGSVKGWVVEAIAPLWHNFVGGHPMAGTADSGIEAAQPNLFTGAAYVLTPTDTTPIEAVERVEAVVKPLQVRLYRCHPEAHDRAVSWISHLPVLVSASLIAACTTEVDPEVAILAKALASSGFRDTSRVGGGNPELGVMMARYNTPALRQSLLVYRDQINHLLNLLEQQDWQALQAMLEQTHRDRPPFLR